MSRNSWFYGYWVSIVCLLWVQSMYSNAKSEVMQLRLAVQMYQSQLEGK